MLYRIPVTLISLIYTSLVLVSSTPPSVTPASLNDPASVRKTFGFRMSPLSSAERVKASRGCPLLLTTCKADSAHSSEDVPIYVFIAFNLIRSGFAMLQCGISRFGHLSATGSLLTPSRRFRNGRVALHGMRMRVSWRSS